MVIGGFVYQAPYRSFASSQEDRRVCMCMVFQDKPADEWTFTWPLYDALQATNTQGVLIGWTHMYMLPENCITVRARSLRWYTHPEGIQWIVQMAAATSTSQLILSLRPGMGHSTL